MRKLGKISFNLIVVLLLVVIAGQFALPPVAEKAVEKVFAEVFPDAKLEIASINAFPAVKLLAGFADDARLTISDFQVNSMNISYLHLSAAGLSWDFRQLFRGFDELPEARKLEVVAQLSESDINSYLDTWVINGFDKLRISLEKDQAVLQGDVQLLGRKYPVQVTGVFLVREGSIWFEPGNVVLKEQQLRADFSKELAAGLGFKLPLELSQVLVPADISVADNSLEILFQKGSKN